MHPPGFFSGRTSVRWGIIGCGDVTEVKSGPGFQKATGSELVAVMRRNEALAADYARRHGVPRYYGKAEDLISDPSVDAIYVATPPDTHASYALMAAAAGKPAYVEKPMARHTPECQRMVDAFALARLPLFVAYYRRRLPRFTTVADIIGNGCLGQITEVAYRYSAPKHRVQSGWRVAAPSSGGGLVLDLGSHVLDLIDFFLGPLGSVGGMAANVFAKDGLEDVVQIGFQTPQGVPGMASFNFSSAISEDVMTISGSEGRVSFSVFESEPIRLQVGSSLEGIDRPHPPHVQQPLIQSVVDDLLGRDTCPSTGESALRTSRVLDQALSGFYGGRDDAFWDRPDTWPGWRRG